MIRAVDSHDMFQERVVDEISRADVTIQPQFIIQDERGLWGSMLQAVLVILPDDIRQTDLLPDLPGGLQLTSTELADLLSFLGRRLEGIWSEIF